jgi:E3 ubiquitin-protein ligase EDD1
VVMIASTFLFLNCVKLNSPLKYCVRHVPSRIKKKPPIAYCDCWRKCKCKALIPGNEAMRTELLKKLVSETDLVTKPNGK